MCLSSSLNAFFYFLSSQELDEKIAYLKDELQENKAETELMSKLTLKESEVSERLPPLLSASNEGQPPLL